MALRLEEDIGTISFPGQAITCIAAPVIAVLTYFADVFFIKKLNIISQIIYVCIGVFSLLNLALGFEPMHLSHMLLLIAYAVAGFYTQDFSIRNYKELDYLSKQEGFPEFLFVIESDTHSKYVKYRKKWLDQDKKLDYFSKSERPVSDFNVVAPENSDHMDGISINDNVREQWFTDMNEASSESNSAAEPASDCMDIIENFQELPAEDYIIEKISNKPL